MRNNTTVDKSPERIRRMFDGIAPWYDFLNHFLSLGIDRSWRRRTAELLLDGDTPPGPLLDVCCGTGDLSFAFDRRLRSPVATKGTSGDRKLYGIDFSSEMIVRAKEKRLRRGSGEIDFAEGDALNLPFETETFAIVCVAFGLRNVRDTQRGIAEMVRVCKPGGTVAILEFSMPDNPFLSLPYRFYFRRILPVLGRFFARNKDGAYRYLPESVLEFDDPCALQDRMRALGLFDLRSKRMTFGIATLTWGRLPEKAEIERSRW